MLSAAGHSKLEFHTNALLVFFLRPSVDDLKDRAAYIFMVFV